MSTQSIRNEVFKTLDDAGLTMSAVFSSVRPHYVAVNVEGQDLLIAPGSMLIVTVSYDGYRAVILNDA